MFLIVEWYCDGEGKKQVSVYRKRFHNFLSAYEYAREKLYYDAIGNYAEGFRIVKIRTK